MNDIRRTLLWVVFVMSLVLLWDGWNRHTGQPTLFGPSPAKVAAGSAPAQAASAAAGLPQAVPTPAQGPATAGTPAVASAANSAAAGGQDLSFKTDVMRLTLNTRGGDLTHLELTRYPDARQPDRPVVLFNQSAQRTYVAQTGLISAQPGRDLPNHFSVLEWVEGPTELAEGQDTLEVSFRSDVVGGVQLTKTFTFQRGQYTIGVRHEVHNVGDAAVQPQLYLQFLRDALAPEGEAAASMMNPTSSYTGPAIYTDAKKFQKVDFKDIEKGKADYEKSSSDGWLAMVQHYFAAAWLPQANQLREYRTAKVNQNLYSIAAVLPMGELAPGERKVLAATLYAGPQEEHKLAALAPGLDLVKDYGWFTVIAKPLFWLLDKLHDLIGNWGWAIVALVVVLKIVFYWLNASAYRSMAKMKAINPRVMEMRERLKDKPQQMQQEMMRIYREEKVNPLGGCLPIFVQMPFFIALYWVLLSSVEMRGAPWLGWITDLSVLDPYFILPLLMTASTLFQTWLNPTPPDPMQAKIMWIMPLVFSIMFFFFPAGLVLYWLTNNILSIAQQWFINKQLGVLGK